MTIKERAVELANKFALKSIFEMDNNELKAARAQAKQCALITVDELIKEDNAHEEYWTEVKQEIEKL